MNRILKWSERYTKTDMVYLFHSSFWVFVGQLATSLSAFIVMVVLANLTSKDTLGEYRYMISVISILMIFTLPGLDTALVQSTARGHEGQLNTAVRTKMLYGLLASGISLIAASYYLLHGNSVLALSYFVVAILMPLFGAYFTYFFFLQGKQRFAEASLTQAGGRIIFLGIMIGTAIIQPTTTALITAFLLSTIVAQYVGSWWTNRRYVQKNNPDDQLISYGKHLSLLGAAGIVATNIDKVLTWYLLGAVPTALYSIATLLPLESIRVGRMLAQALLPKFSAMQSVHKQHAAVLQKILMFMVVLGLGWALYALCAPWFFQIFFPDYVEIVPHTIVAMAIIFTTPVYVIRSLFTSQKYTRALNRTLIDVPVVKTILFILGMIYGGLWGAIVMFVIGGLLELIYNLYFLSRMEYDLEKTTL